MSNPHGRRNLIPQNWKAHEVQAALEFNPTEWQRFLYHTGEEGNHLKLTFEALQWRDIPAKPKLTLIDNVKRRLEEEGISINDQLEQGINWRMRQFFKAKKPKQGSPRPQPSNSKHSGEQSREGFQSAPLLTETSETEETAPDEERTEPEDKQEKDGDDLEAQGKGKEAASMERVSLSRDTIS